MKWITQIFLIGSLLYAPLGIYAQDAIDKYFEMYASDPDFTSIVISSKMFELFTQVDVNEPEGEKVKEAISGLKGIRILAYDNEEGVPKAVDFKKSIAKIGSEYELLMSVDDKSDKVRFFIREEGDKIAELFMVVGGDKNLFLMSLVGDIDIEKMSELSKSMNVGGMNYLKNLDDSKKK
ncbi:MAG TPA: DUF4252 domain-containing protein [Cryomorphaceae bacterium]|nr:DUF4252 domain-containing protein [Cryomorphaceae bacterium]